MVKAYAGIGSRKTPKHILEIMKQIGCRLALMGWHLRTGACQGADQAFAEGVVESHKKDPTPPLFRMTMCVPWESYEKKWINSLDINFYTNILKNSDKEAFMAVDRFHPAPHKLSQGARRLHARNHNILTEVKFVVCWTPEGKGTGGTGQALREARARGIPIKDLGNPKTLDKVMKFLNSDSK